MLDAQAYAGQYAKSYARQYAKASTSPCVHSRLKALCYNNTASNSTAPDTTPYQSYIVNK